MFPFLPFYGLMFLGGIPAELGCTFWIFLAWRVYRPIKDEIKLCFQETVELNAYDEKTAAKEAA